MKKFVFVCLIVPIFFIGNKTFAMGDRIYEKPKVLMNKTKLREDYLRIYYFPLSLWTLLPITLEDIEGAAKCVKEIPKNSEEAIEIKKLLNKTVKAEFQDGVVRLKIEGLYADEVYVDAEASYIIGKSAYKLDTTGFKRLESIMEGLCKEELKPLHEH